MASKGQKKKDSGRASAASKEGTASSVKGIESKTGSKHQFTIWPEWSDVDVNAEKWDTPQKAGGKEKGKSPSLQFFDDPDGVLELPPTLEVSQWKRLHEHYQDRLPVVVEDPNCLAFDLLAPNEHIHHSETIRWIISQITALWKLNGTSMAFVPELGSTSQTEFTSWKPWEHIYAMSKLGKGPNIPQYNHYGKYAVRLFWMGCWRKIMVDDNVPFDENENILLPCTTLKYELWPILLSKAIIKVLSIDYSSGSLDCEFGEQSVMHCLTGWLPEPVPIMPSYMEKIWDLLKNSCPEFTLPDPNDAKQCSDLSGTSSDVPDLTKKEDTALNAAPNKEAGASKETKKGKDSKKDRAEPTKVEKPQTVVFATYFNPPKLPKTFSKYKDTSETSETLRTVGLSHTLPHPLLVTRTRSCPLVAPPIPPPEPAWKLIRQPKKKSFQNVTDEPMEEQKRRPEMWVEISSPYLNYKVTPSALPQDVTGRKSSSKGHGSRPSTAPPVEEVDESPAGEEPDVKNAAPVEETKAIQPVPPSQPKPQSQGASTTAGNSKVGDRNDIGSKESQAKTASVPASHEKSEKRPSHVSATSSNISQSKKVAIAGEGESGQEPRAAEAQPRIEVQDSRFQMAPEVVERKTDSWVHWEDFQKAFKSVVLYHKPQSYAFKETASDFKTGGGGGIAQSAVGGKKPGASAGGQSKLGSQSPSISSGEDRQPIFFSVDSLKPIQVLISFSALSKWIEPSATSYDSVSTIQHVTSAAALASAATGKLRLDKKPTFVSEAPTIYSDHESNKDGVGGAGGLYDAFRRRANMTPGILVAEPYSWKSLVIGNPILSLKTTGVKSMLLNLPPGRHILRFHITAPLAWVVNMCSTTRFYFGDEENVMSTVVNESLRFQEHAVQLIQRIGRAIQNFSDAENFKEAMDELKLCYNPTEQAPDNIEVFRKAFYVTVGDLMGDALTSDAVFGLRCLTCDLQTESVIEAAVGRKNPEDAEAPTAPAPPQTGGKKDGKKDSKAKGNQAPAVDQGRSTTSALDIWKERDPTDEELGSVAAIQSAWKGFYTRAVIASREIGTTEHNKAREQLQKVWSFLENSMESCGLTLLRAMFKIEPDQLERFPFSSDEWTKIAYADYSGQFGEQGPATWFVLFRSVFSVEDTVLLVPKLSSSIPTAFLRVVNNDTGEEIPKVFMRVAPYNFTKNQRGYTFFCEARTTDVAVASGRWRMRLIGNQAPLPTPSTGDSVLNSNLFTREVKDYYVPNERNIILRYAVKVTEDHLLSLQLQTSKSDVYFELEILDNEQVLLSTRGKGHAVIPAFLFQKDSSASRENSAKTKRSVSGDRKTSKADSGTARKGDKQEVQIADEPVEPENAGPAEPEFQPHKYIIQARVLRKSWPLNQTAWAHVAMLKEQEREEMKANFDENRPGSARSNAGAGSASAGKTATKSAGGKNLKPEKSAKGTHSSRPTSQQFDNDKPHWLLRVVVDSSDHQQGDCEVKKDTERVEQIRAMKQAWERADPGRAERAAARRAAFLAKYMVPVEPTDSDVENAQKASETVAKGESPTPVAPEPSEPEPTSKSAASGKSRKQSLAREATQATEDSVQVVAEPAEPEVLTLEPPSGPPPKMVLKPLDLSPFTVKARDGARILVDEEELSREREQKVAEFAEWNRVRAEMKRRREEELAARNQEKIRQIQDYEALQEMVDQARADIAARKEAYRQRILQAEQAKLDALAALENGGVNPESEKPTSASKKGGRKSPKTSAKGSKKGSAKGKKK